MKGNLSAFEAISDRHRTLWASRGRPSANVTFPLLGSRKFHQGVDGLPFVRVGFDKHLPTRSDPPPFPHQTELTEKIALNCYPIVAPHVARRVKPPQMQQARKHFELMGRFSYFHQTFLELSLAVRFPV